MVNGVFILKHKTTGYYWNNTTSAWQVGAFENPAVLSSTGNWILEIIGANRRLFANSTILVEFRAKNGQTTYTSATIPELTIR